MSCKGDMWVVTAIGGVVSGAFKNPKLCPDQCFVCYSGADLSEVMSKASC
jgi:hypothetical protein